MRDGGVHFCASCVLLNGRGHGPSPVGAFFCSVSTSAGCHTTTFEESKFGIPLKSQTDLGEGAAREQPAPQVSVPVHEGEGVPQAVQLERVQHVDPDPPLVQQPHGLRQRVQPPAEVRWTAQPRVRRDVRRLRGPRSMPNPSSNGWRFQGTGRLATNISQNIWDFRARDLSVFCQNLLGYVSFEHR